MKTTSNWFGCVLLALALVGGGCSGDEGKDGKPGADGANGDAGATGAKGTEGAKGAMGAMGTMGAKGDPGANGDPGADGDAGTDGDDGAMGAMGAMGTMGVSGIINRTKLTGNYIVYPLLQTQTSGISGSVRFAEFIDGSVVGTLISIKISGTNVPDTIRTSHIHIGNVPGGTTSTTLNNVDGFTPSGNGVSETLITATNAGAPITFAGLTGYSTPGVAGGTYVKANGFDGYVNVHPAPGDNGTVTTQVVSGGIGLNGP